MAAQRPPLSATGQITLTAPAKIDQASVLLAQSEIDHPEWHAKWEHTPPMECDMDELLAMTNEAPSDFLRGYLTGIRLARLSLAMH